MITLVPSSDASAVVSVPDNGNAFAVGNEVGQFPMAIDADGSVRVARIVNESDPNLVIVDHDGTNGRLRVAVPVQNRPGLYFRYIFVRGSDPLSLNLWVFDQVHLCRRLGPTTGEFSEPAIATSSRSGTAVSTVTVSNAGKGYTVAPSVVFDGGGGTGATATATIDADGRVTGVTVTNGGTGYTSNPSVQLRAPDNCMVVGGGANDIVYSESTGAGNTSIDYPAQTVAETFIGGTGHGDEYPLNLSASGGAVGPVIWCDGVAMNPAWVGREFVREFRMMLTSRLYRGRSPAQTNGGTTPPWCIQTKTWRITSSGLRVDFLAQLQEQFTGIVYAPLTATQTMYTDCFRDGFETIGGSPFVGVRLTLPDDIANAVVADTTNNVRRIAMRSDTFGSAIIDVDSLEMFAAGNYPHTPKVPGTDRTLIRTTGGYHKTYFVFGGPLVNVGGIDYSRWASGDILKGGYNLQFLLT